MIKFIMKKILLFIQFIARIFRRALCCFKRQRRNSYDQAPLTAIGIVSNGEVIDNGENWEGWNEGGEIEDKCSETERHIKMYRQQRANLNQAKNDEEPKVDFFLDMAPRIVKQKKLLLQSEKTETSNNSLSLAPDPMFNTADLGVWEENQSWEAEADGDKDVLMALREQRRQERDRRQQDQHKRKNEKIRPGVAGRIS